MPPASTAPPKIKYHSDETYEFYYVLRRRVDDYFKCKHLSKYGDWRIRLKIFILYALLLSSYFMMYAKNNSGGMVLVYAVISGISSIMIALNIVHDASHNALFRE